MSVPSFEVRFHSILGPALDRFSPEDRDRVFAGNGPLVVMTALPGRPELLPTLHLLNTGLASVFLQRTLNRS